MNGLENIKQFNKAVKSYVVSRNGEHERIIERNLQLLASSSDLTVFDPGHKDTIEFYVNLHELMVGLDAGTSLAWAAIACLKEATRNTSARRDLIHTYQFMPILTRFLTARPTQDRETKLLRLMEELTYGVKISWQEAHLSRLITTLTNLITSNVDQERMTLSLSVLVNLCYKNLPAVYALMRSIDIKKFLKTVLKLQSHNESSKVQVCKLMIILKSVTGGLPDPDVQTYLKSVCPTLTDALRKGNSSLMRQTVSFYKEMSTSNKDSVLHLQESTDICSEMETLLSSVSEDEQTNSDCLDILFEYLCETVGFECLDLENLYPKLLALAFQWVCSEGVSTNALNLITTITSRVSKISSEDSAGNEVTNQVLDVMNEQLSVILLLLDMDGRVRSNESYQRLTALLHLLSKMINIPKFTDKILTSLDPKVFRSLFEELRLPDLQQNSLFQESVYSFYVKALVFLQELSDKETSWLILSNELLSQKQVQFILSVALFVGSEDIKMRVLQLTTTPGFDHKCREVLAACLTELNKLVIFSPFGSKKNEVAPSDYGMTPMDITPILTVTQEDHLNSLLDKFEHDSAKNGNSVTSAVMELYQFKVAAMSQSIRKMQSSQEAADKRATDLQHNLALTTSEVSRLHHLLHSTQQSFEAAAKENSKLTNQISDIQSQANDLHNKHSQAVQTLRSKTRIIHELTTELKEAQKAIVDSTAERDQLNERLQEELAAKQELQSCVSDLDGQLESTKQALSDCKKDLAHHKKELEFTIQKLDQMKKDYLNQTTEYSKLEKAKALVDAEAADLNKQLNMISQLAMKRKVDK
uniref:Protein CIP2A n=1 Tax=Lygus hesperus TaxID=30085 RepID=A0A146LU18_LYGHE